MVAGLNGHSWFGLVVYAVVMGLIIRGVRIPIGHRLSEYVHTALVKLRVLDAKLREDERARTTATAKGHTNGDVIELKDSTSEVHSFAEDRKRPMYELVLDLRTAPLAGVILLLITRTIGGDVVRLGIVGDADVQPYDVLVLFISLAYISTALDATGGLRALAFFISKQAAKQSKLSPPSADKSASGTRMYFTLLTFWFASGLIVGNDPIVLSGTAFLCYFTRFAGITTPTAWIFSQFIAANIASAPLVSSNPTNVLIASAFGLNFLTGYTARTILPSLAAAAVAFPFTYFTFSARQPSKTDATERGKPSAAYIPKRLILPDVDPKSALIDPAGAIFHTSLLIITLVVLVGTSFVPGHKVAVWMVTAPAGIIALLYDLATDRRLPASSTAPPSQRWTVQQAVRGFKRRFPATSTTIDHLPLPLLLFAGGVFVLARALTSLGWTSIFASWLAKLSPTPAACVFFIGYFTTLVMCPLCGTNIGATILIVEIIRDPRFSQAPHVLANPKILRGAIFSTAMASNLGAFSWTFSSSLAGLLWITILRQKGLSVSTFEFAKWNLWFLPLLTTVSSAVVLVQTLYL